MRLCVKRAKLPLTALRSFEAAGRHESFTQAANELFVSQAAISRQIREFEARLGVALFDRLAQGVRLTTPGRELLLEITPAFDRMENALARSSSAYGQSELTLSVEPGFASCWLMPRLGRFQAAFPEIEINLSTDERVIEFRPHEPQLAIRYSTTATSWRNAEATHLLDQVMVPVWVPGMLGAAELHSPKALIAHRLLRENGTRDWYYWCSQNYIEFAEPDRGQRYDHMGLILQAALNGQGVALVDQLFAAPYLETGELVTAFRSIDGPGAYWLVTPSFSELSQAGQVFSDWIRKELYNTHEVRRR